MTLSRSHWLRGALLCLPLFALAAKPEAPEPVATPDDTAEYALWSALITHGLGADAGQIVIADQTTTETGGVAAPGAKLDELAKKLDVTPALLEAWLAANDHAMPLARRFSLKVDYRLLDARQRAELFTATDPAAGWAKFRERFPTAPGLLRLSRAAFDPDQRRALAYIEYTCGPACGSGRLIRAERKGQGWQVLSGELIWIAGP